jgi:hypothetical protein
VLVALAGQELPGGVRVGQVGEVQLGQGLVVDAVGRRGLAQPLPDRRPALVGQAEDDPVAGPGPAPRLDVTLPLQPAGLLVHLAVLRRPEEADRRGHFLLDVVGAHRAPGQEGQEDVVARRQFAAH